VTNRLLDDIDISIAFIKEDQERLCEIISDELTPRPKRIACIKHWVRLKRDLAELEQERQILLEVLEYGDGVASFDGLL
jgi:hypothetical protein